MRKDWSSTAARWMTALLSLAALSSAGGDLLAQSPGGPTPAVIADEPSEIDAMGDPYVEVDSKGRLTFSGLYAQGENPSQWLVRYFPDAYAPRGIALPAAISADAGGFFSISTPPLSNAISPRGGLLTIQSPMEWQPSIVISIAPGASRAAIRSPMASMPGKGQSSRSFSSDAVGPVTVIVEPADKNRMRLQLQQGKETPWSGTEKHPDSPVTKDEIKKLLDKLLKDYQDGNITEGPPRDKKTEKDLEKAIDQLKKDLDEIPASGVSNNGNVKRKEFKDSKGGKWRIDLENNAGTNLTQ